MKKGLLTTVITLVLVGTISLSAFGYGNSRRQGPRQMVTTRLYQDLNLTPDQQQKILEIRQDFQKDTQTLRFEIQKIQLELRQLWSAQVLNQSQIEAKVKELTGLRVQLVTKARTMREEVKKVLTPDQLKKFEENALNRVPGAGRGKRRGGTRMGGFFGV